MAPLLFLTAALLVISGAVETRAAVRSGLGAALLPAVELAAGLGLAAVAAGGGSSGLARWLIPGGVLLVLVSSVRTSVLLKERRRIRELSAAARLETYVRYLAGPPRDGEAR